MTTPTRDEPAIPTPPGGPDPTIGRIDLEISVEVVDPPVYGVAPNIALEFTGFSGLADRVVDKESALEIATLLVTGAKNILEHFAQADFCQACLEDVISDLKVLTYEDTPPTKEDLDELWPPIPPTL